MTDHSSSADSYTLQELYANSKDCIKVMSREGTLISLNPKGSRLLEIDDQRKIIGSVWVDFWDNDAHDRAKAAVAAANNGEVGSFEGYCATLKGTPKWWDVVVAPIRNDMGEITQLLAISRDITERKLAEQELVRINAALLAKQAELERAEGLLERMLQHTERHAQ